MMKRLFDFFASLDFGQLTGDAASMLWSPFCAREKGKWDHRHNMGTGEARLRSLRFALGASGQSNT